MEPSAARTLRAGLGLVKAYMRRVDYTGHKFGWLTVLSRTDRTVRGRTTCFLRCRCQCGTIKEIRYGNLVNKKTSSCGCRQREMLSQRSRKPAGHSIKRSIWNYYQRNAKIRDLPWKLDEFQFFKLIESPCHYCGTVAGTTTHSKWQDSFSHNGVDRFDPSLGYTPKNCVPCCKKCNWAKRDMPTPEFEEWIMNVYWHLFEGD